MSCRARLTFALVLALVSFARPGRAAPQCTVERARLQPTDSQISQRFGTAVSAAGVTLVAGAPGDNELGPSAGAAYVFTRVGTQWSEQQKLVAGDPSDAANFGHALSVDGEFALVGALLDDHAGLGSGAAYVFVRSGTVWTQQAKLVANDASPLALFGASVALEGTRAVVGAPNENDRGAAYVFERSGTSWVQRAKLSIASGAENDEFGDAVAVDGTTIVVGAEAVDGVATNSGAGYVFVQSGRNWIQQAKLTASDAGSQHRFGTAVALDGDELLISAEGHSAAGFASGAAYVFVRNGTSWNETARLTASDAGPQDHFGISVAFEGGIALIGAEGDDDGDTDSGAAYLFARSGSSWTEQVKIKASATSDEQAFGRAVGLSGAVAAVGATGEDDSAGAVYALEVAAAPVSYCTAKVNSCGTQPSILSSGTPSAGATSGFVVAATNAKAQKVGVLIYSGTGRAAISFQGGLLCVDPTPLRRSVPIGNAGGTPPACDGVLAIDMAAFAAGSLGGTPASFLREPGARVNAQIWARDTPGNSLLSDALEYVVCD